MSISVGEVLAALGEVRDPELDRPITDLGFVADVRIGAGVRVELRLPTYFCAPNFAHNDPIRAVTQCGAQQVRDGHGGHRHAAAERRASTSRFEPHVIRLFDQNLGGFLEQRDAIRVRNQPRERVEQRRFSGARTARDQDVLAVHDRGAQ